ncbi:MAG TPA: hypothetical protein VE978_27775 [Chitinophagales bacterium]|nr:hypothetical protein [Chitinophagales bacterium]
MESFRPYVWLRKQSSQYNEFFTISIPANFRVSAGLQGPYDDTTAGVRTYKFAIEAHLTSTPSVADGSVGDHSQPANISTIEFEVIDTSDPSKPVRKGLTDTEYQNADDVG